MRAKRAIVVDVVGFNFKKDAVVRVNAVNELMLLLS